VSIEYGDVADSSGAGMRVLLEEEEAVCLTSADEVGICLATGQP
jgi:hypothetical protein